MSEVKKRKFPCPESYTGSESGIQDNLPRVMKAMIVLEKLKRYFAEKFLCPEFSTLALNQIEIQCNSKMVMKAVKAMIVIEVTSYLMRNFFVMGLLALTEFPHISRSTFTIHASLG